MKTNQILIATRKSPLALWQAETTMELLRKASYNCELLPLVTTGDKMQKTKLSEISLAPTDANKNHLTTGKGLFIKEIQEALLAGQAHVAVHSLKDLPVKQTENLCLSTFLPRGATEDVLVISSTVLQESGLSQLSKQQKNQLTFTELKSYLEKSDFYKNNAFGTTSLRRTLQIKKHFGEQARINLLRGNVDSRLKKVLNHEFSCILLAKAGLERLGLYDKHEQNIFVLDPHFFIPAAGQGVVGIEVHANDKRLLTTLQQFSQAELFIHVGLERLIMFLLGGDCHTSIGAYFHNKELHVFAGDSADYLNTVILISDNDLTDLKKLYTTSNAIFTPFFEQLCQSSVAQKVRQQLKSNSFYKINSDL